MGYGKDDYVGYIISIGIYYINAVKYHVLSVEITGVIFH